MYDVEIVIKRRHAQPFRVPQVGTEERVKEIIEGFLAAWGLPAPDSLRDTGLSLFVERLAEAGRYKDEDNHHHIVVRRADSVPIPYEEHRASLRAQLTGTEPPCRA